MEYDSFVKNLAKDSPHSARCLPETRYSHEFEQRMEALVLNFDIEGTCSSGQDTDHYREASEAQLVSSFDIPAGFDSQDGMLCKDYEIGDKRTQANPDSTLELKDEGESSIEPKLGETLDIQYLSDSLSGIEQCSKVEGMLIEEEYSKNLGEENNDIMFENSVLNKSLCDTSLSIPAKRTYDQANEAVDYISIKDASLSKSMKTNTIASSKSNDHQFPQPQDMLEYGEERFNLPRQ